MWQERIENHLLIREATENDLASIINMLIDDSLGQTRESLNDASFASYLAAFREIARDINNYLLVLEKEGEVIGTLQLTYIPCLTHQGSMRAQIEGVRVNREYRGKGHGSILIKWAVTRAIEKGCQIVQLTTNQSRTEAVRFYQSLGFQDSHIGMKLVLTE